MLTSSNSDWPQIVTVHLEADDERGNDIARRWAARNERRRSQGCGKGAAPRASVGPMLRQPEPRPIAAKALRTAQAADVLGSPTRFRLRREEAHAQFSLCAQFPQMATVV